MSRRRNVDDAGGRGGRSEGDAGPSAASGAPGASPFAAGWLGLTLAALAAGLLLRLSAPTRLPEGPWIDEVSAIRAARTLAAAPAVDPFGTSPILPPEAGFAGAQESNLFLLLTRAVDRAAGGGMASVRALSLGPSAALFLAALLLAWEVGGGDRRTFAFAALLLSGSSWLLRVGRWGWFNLTTAALLVAALALALSAVRRRRLGPALAAGALLGLAQYGYLASRVGLAFAGGALAVAGAGLVAGRARAEARVALAVFGTALLVSLPLFVHLVSEGEGSTERVRELAPAGGAAALPRAVLGNAGGLADLFFGAGDPNPRHAEPGRPLVPLLVGLAILAGAVGAVHGGGAPRVCALAGLAILSTNLLTKGGPEAANSFRVVAAAAPLLVAAASAWDGLARLLERRLPRAGAPLAAGFLVVISARDAAGFVRWGRSAETDRLFGAPERRLADRLRGLGAGSDAEVLLASRAADERTTYVELLLAPARSLSRGLRVEPSGLPIPSPRFGALPRADVLFVDLDTGECDRTASRVGGRAVAEVPEDAGRRPLCVVRIGAERARAAAQAQLDRHPRLEPDGGGPVAEVVAEEDGLFRLDVEGAGGAGSLFLRLAPGRYTSAGLVPPGSRLVGIVGPDGFPRRLAPARGAVPPAARPAESGAARPAG